MARPLPVLKLSSRVGNVLAFARSVATALTSNPLFPTPPPILAALDAHIDALQIAEAAVLARTKGAVETRDAALTVVRADLHSLKAYVQSVALVAAPADALAIIEASGMTRRKVTLPHKPVLAAKQGATAGTVRLAAKAVADKASYLWEYATDPSSWTPIRQTMQAKTSVVGLRVGTTYLFRVQAVTSAGLSDWSQEVALLVT